MNQVGFQWDFGEGALEAAFWRFHRANPHVYQLFSRFALEAARTGRKRFGVSMIWERMRWYSTIETQGEHFKLNNNHRAFYARLWMADHPEHPEFFSTRRQRTETTL